VLCASVGHSESVTVRLMPAIEPARVEDLDAIDRMLTQHHLPLAGLHDHIATTLVARENGTVVGSAALELYEDGALLRSVAVAPGRERLGLGRTLTEAALRLAATLNAPAVFLLTTTADQYFPRFGFEAINRTEVPASVQTSVEFTGACPSSATVMCKRL
jgi:amino-acid N-acetyltransferase